MGYRRAECLLEKLALLRLACSGITPRELHCMVDQLLQGFLSACTGAERLTGLQCLSQGKDEARISERSVPRRGGVEKVKESGSNVLIVRIDRREHKR